MDWQQVVSLLIVAAAAALLLRGRLRSRRVAFGRQPLCGACAASSSATPPSIVYHARKGERPRIIVRAQ